MEDPKVDADQASPKKLDPAKVAKLVKRVIPPKPAAEGQEPPKETLQAIRPEEVLDYAIRDGKIVVVTTSGEKLVGDFKD